MSEAAHKGPSGQPSGYTGSDAALAFVEAQIEHCVETHPLCGGRQPRAMPTRVIEILDRRRVRLMHTNGKLGLYAALSHCWGNNVALQTTFGSLASQLNEISWESLPRTFQDAIDFCQRLGLKYLWIDSLCIIQDQQSDWLYESAKMRDIYRNAHVTLAATASLNGNGGCYQTKPALKEPRCQSCENSLFEKQVDDDTPLLGRAWALQERLLSARVIHFMADEIAWECRRSETCECRTDLARSAGRTHVPHNSDYTLRRLVHSAPFKQTFAATSTFSDVSVSLEAWLHIVECYSTLSLTYPTDKLPALAGIARWMDNIKFGEYHAGLWGTHMPQCLSWYAQRPSGPRLANSSPSWSWSSTGSRVAHALIDPSHKSGPTIVPHCVRYSLDPFGAVLEGQLHVKAELFEVKTVLHRKSKSDDQYYTNVGVPVLDVVFEDETILCHWDSDVCGTWLETRPSPWPLPQNDGVSISLYCFTLGAGARQISMVLFCDDWDRKIFRRVGLAQRKIHDWGLVALGVEAIWLTERSVDNGKTNFTIK